MEDCEGRTTWGLRVKAIRWKATQNVCANAAPHEKMRWDEKEPEVLRMLHWAAPNMIIGNEARKPMAKWRGTANGNAINDM